jgi:hypothetical protein
VLTEYRNVRQEAGGRRRWFEADGLELIVWYAKTDEIDGFQLCYWSHENPYALTWRRRMGFTHDHIEMGEDDPLKNETPVLQPAGAAPWAKITTLFAADSAGLEASLRELILQRLAAKK